MSLFRIANSLYKDDLTGAGAALYGGRWNSKGNAMLYLTEHISLAVLEILVNFNKAESPLLPGFHLLTVELPEADLISIQATELKKNWVQDFHYTQFMGDEFLKTNSNLFLRVPSAVIPEEHNYLINPLHKDFKKIKIVKSTSYKLDGRLLG